MWSRFIFWKLQKVFKQWADFVYHDGNNYSNRTTSNAMKSFTIPKVDRLSTVDILEIMLAKCEVGLNRIIVVRLGSKGSL